MLTGLKDDKSYIKSLKWFFLLFGAVTLFLVITFLLIVREYRHSVFEDEKLTILKEEFNSINKKFENQISNSYLQIHDVFLDFSDLQDEVVKSIGLTKKEYLDSLVDLNEFGSIKLKGSVKYRISLIKELEEVEELLINTDAISLFEKKENKKEFNITGKTLIKSWRKHTILINRYLNKLKEETFNKTEKTRSRVLYFSILMAIIFFLFLIYFIWFMIYRVLSDIRIINMNTKNLVSGKKPIINAELTGESKLINDQLISIYSDLNSAKFLLDQIHTDRSKVGDLLKNRENNIFYKSIKQLNLQLLKIENQEKQRRWESDGITILTEIVNQYSTDPEKLYNEFISTLVKYSKAIQGGIFINNEEEGYLQLTSSYAYDRIKKRKKIIRYGEGLVGEVWEEKMHVYIENVPEDHFHVKSALGSATSTSLLIVPLKERELCYGVLEVSSFSEFTESKQNFILKAVSVLASATSNINSNLRTMNLLKDSQTLANKLKDQEDEMLARIEELNKQKEFSEKKQFAKDLLIKEIRLEKDHCYTELKAVKKEYEIKTNGLEKQLTESKTDNETIRKMDSEIAALNQKMIDLLETIKIKDLKIEKLRKKIASLQGEN